MDIFDATAEFNREIIGLPFPSRPQRLSTDRKTWTAEAVTEERDELLLARTVADEADAILDTMYFCGGRLYEMGITPGQSRAALELIHAANMQKKRGSLSKRPSSLGYDAIKPEGWVAPDLNKVLLDYDPSTQTPPLVLGQRTQAFQPARTYDAGDIVLVGNPGFATGGHVESLYRPDNNLPGNTYTFPDYPVYPSTLREATRLIDERYVFEVPVPKIILLGYARHGKDTVAEMLRDDYGYRFRSSSEFCAEHVVMPHMNAMLDRLGLGNVRYTSVKECYEDRVNHRQDWYDAITAYNTPDLSRLGREIFRENDLYCGMRNKRELWANKIRATADYVIWVDRSEHQPPEPTTSCTVEPWMADFVLDNNGTLDQLRTELEQLMEGLGVSRKASVTVDIETAVH